jgi:hypothetical protein
LNKKKAYKKGDIEGQAEIMADKMIGMTMPLDMTIETDKPCDELRISLVVDPALAKLVKKDGNNVKDFK